MIRRAIAKARFMALLPYSPDHTRVTNMLAPRTPAETGEGDSTEAAADATDGPAEGQSAPETAEAAAADSGEQTPEAKESGTEESAPAAEPVAAEATEEEAPTASTEPAPDVAQPEDKPESDDGEEAKA